MWFRKLLIRVSLVLVVAFLVACGVTFGLIQSASRDLPNVDSLNRFEPYLTTEIFAADGEPIGKIFAENRELLTWKDIPPSLKNAIVAVEDARFYSHYGVDPRGVIRAVMANLRHKELVEGGSTITQQLARNLFLSPKRSLDRKIKEALLALEIERRFSKDEILVLYLNQVYFGAGAYGAQSASRTYFGKPAGKLDLAESAMLAGLPQAPSVYSPFVDMGKAKARQREVLEKMRQQGYVTEDEKEKALAESLRFVKPKESFQGYLYPYFSTYVIHELFEKYPADLVYKGGLKIYTTLDPKDQEAAQNALQKYLDRGRRERMNVSQGALVAVEPKTGFIRAMVGGYRFSKDNQFNRAWQARRQPGSAFKIFVYAAALDHGFKPDQMVVDSPVSYPSFQGPWVPRNDDGRFMGAMTVRRALALSRNVVAVKIAAQLGIQEVIEYAHRMGVDEPLDPYLPTAIGASVVTPVEMVTAANTLANEGIRVNPTAIKMVKDRNGNIIEDNSNPIRKEAIPAQTARMLTDLMQDVIKYGTGKRANIGRPAAGKTGTASDFRDAWFVGFTPDLACVVWIGNDDFSKMVEAYGGYLPAMTWSEFMKQALKGVPPHGFTPLQSPQAQQVVKREEPREKKPKEVAPSPSPSEKSTEEPSPSPTESEKVAPKPTENEPILLDESNPDETAPDAEPSPSQSPPPKPKEIKRI